MEPRVDLRIVKTHKNIRGAFIELLSEKDFNAITVQDILDIALINRSTFYKHYTDKYDLAESIAHDFLEEFITMTKVDVKNRGNFDLLMERWDKTFEKFYERKSLILGLWKIRTDKVHVYEDMTAILKDNYFLLAASQVKENYNMDFQARIFASVTMATLSYMMENPERHSAHELIGELQKYYGILSIAPPNNR